MLNPYKSWDKPPIGAGIKQLKRFLHRRGVRVPQSIAEKGDLVALVEQSKVWTPGA